MTAPRVLFANPGRALGGAEQSLLLERDDLRAGLAKAARERVEREFTAERMIARTLEVYGQVVG